VHDDGKEPAFHISIDVGVLEGFSEEGGEVEDGREGDVVRELAAA